MKPILIIAITLLMLTACKSKQMPSTIAYKANEVECLGKDPSGAVRMRVYGVGKDMNAAKENARKIAVETVVFSNISGNEVSLWPVIDNHRTRQTNRIYFDKFFKDGGKFKKFVKAEKADKKSSYIGNNRVMQELEVTIDRDGLINQFIKDKILE